jgi:excisionase family DNA binding protein
MAREEQNDLPPYRVREVARKFGLSNKAVLDAIAGARVPAFRIGKAWLIPRKWVDSQGGEA